MLLQLVLDGLGEKRTREFGLSWVLGVRVGRELRKGNLGDSAAEKVSGFVARKSGIVSEGEQRDQAQKQKQSPLLHGTNFTALEMVCCVEPEPERMS